MGQQVTKLRADEGTESVVWDASHTFGGVYHATITIGERSETTRVVVRR
jgi:hypothetical protein